MSGVELALAIAPIFLSACQGVVDLQEKFRVFRHYKKEIKWLRRKVEIQAKCYKGEIHNLVIATLEDKHKAQSMVHDDKHSYWKEPDLETAFKKYMGKQYGDFLSAAKDVHQALVNIRAKLAVFAPPDVNSDLFQVTKDRFRLTFKKDQYQDDIDTLKESVRELKRVRKLAATFAKLDRPTANTLAHLTTTDLPVHNEMVTVRQYRSIRYLSSNFQAFLREQWTCCDPSHSRHEGTLFLNSASDRRPSVLWLLGSSGIRYTTRTSNRLLFNVVSQAPGLLTPDSEPKSFEERSPKRQRRSPQPLPSQQALVPVDDPVPSLCKQLEAASLDPRPHQHPLIRNDVQRKDFYKFEPQQVHSNDHKAPKSPNISITISTWNLHETKCLPLSQLLSVPHHHVMLDRDRIRLAAALVRATLMGHSTPGWSGLRDNQQLLPGCLLEQISFLSQESADISTGVDIDSLLVTLNIPISVGGSASQPSKTIASSHSDTDMTDAVDISTHISTEEELRDAHGIRNLVLWRLGVALLSIALWERIPWQKFATVRKKARALNFGGNDYRCAVNKLINGDFGLGTDELDLEDECLQIQIVKTIVGPLEKNFGLISSHLSQNGGGAQLSSENLRGFQAQSGGGGKWLPDAGGWVSAVHMPPPPYSGPEPGLSTLVGSPRGMDGGDGEYFPIVESPQ